MEYFNKLTPDQLERLALLAEEMGEVQQVIGKIIRHGWASQNPTTGIGNVEKLESELGDVMAIINMMYSAGDIDERNVDDNVINKLKRITQYLHHN